MRSWCLWNMWANLRMVTSEERKASRTGGSLSYLRELEHRRRETPGLRFIVAVDRKIRKKVHQLVVEKRLEFGTYSEALFEVLDRHEIYWTEARLDTRVESPLKRRRAKSPAKRKRRSLSPSNSHERKGRSPRSQSPRRKVAAAVKTEIKGAKVPAEKWQKLKKEGSPKVSGTCRFYNHSCGCTRKTVTSSTCVGFVVANTGGLTVISLTKLCESSRGSEHWSLGNAASEDSSYNLSGSLRAEMKPMWTKMCYP